MGAYVAEPLIFLIDTLFSLYILAIMLRFLLQWNKASTYNPVLQGVIKLTHPPLKLLRRYIPAWHKIDSAALVLALILQMLADAAILGLKGVGINWLALSLIASTQLVALALNIFIFAIFANALLSWFNPGGFNAVAQLLYSLSEPVLRICRQVLPDTGSIDFSPLAALILLQLTKMLVLPPLQDLANLIS